jgi:hypothetical protein
MSYSKYFAFITACFIVIYFSGCKDNSTSPSSGSSHMSLVGSYNTPDYANGVSVMQVNSLRYAFVADGASGLQIVNVTSPSSPSFASSFNTSGTAVDVTTASINNRNYAFVSDGSNGLVIINVTNISSPVFNTTLHFQGDGVLTSFVDEHNKILLIGTYYGYIHIFNLAYLPDSVTQYSVYSSPLDNILGISVYGGLAYVAENTQGLEIVHVMNPAAPINVSYYDTPGNANDVKVGGSYAYIADGSSLYIVNISNPFSPTFAGQVNTEGAVYTGVALNYPLQAFTSDYELGVETFTLSSPFNPQQIGYYNTSYLAGNITYANSYIFVADGADGLLILSFY